MKFTLALTTLLFFMSNIVSAQSQPVKDTVYYLVDTASTPIKDRIFSVGREGKWYGYRLHCKCFPWQTDPVFIRYTNAKDSTILSKNDILKLNLITLKKLIEISVAYGIDRKKNTIFYFIEPMGDKFIWHKVFLSEPKKPYVVY